MSLRVNVALAPSGTLSETYGWATSTDQMPSSDFPQIVTSLTNGSGSEQANQWATIKSTLAAGTDEDWDLTDLDNVFGAVNLSNVKMFLLALDAPDGDLYLEVTPGQSNGFLGWELDAGGGETVYSTMYRENIFDGWAVGSTTKVINVNNPTASAILYRAWIVGIE